MIQKKLHDHLSDLLKKSKRKKGTSFQSAMSMLAFYKPCREESFCLCKETIAKNKDRTACLVWQRQEMKRLNICTWLE